MALSRARAYGSFRSDTSSRQPQGAPSRRGSWEEPLGGEGLAMGRAGFQFHAARSCRMASSVRGMDFGTSKRTTCAVAASGRR